MKALATTAAVGLALAASGCARETARPALTRLDCPETESGLKRVGAAADGKSCAYVSTDGAEITLKLIPVVGGVDATLKAVEADLRASLTAEPEGDAAAAEAAGEGRASATEASPSAASEAAAVLAQAQADAAAREKAADADWESGSTDRSGDRTRIDLPGIHIEAEDEKANLKIGPVHIDAQGDGAVIRMQRDVRLRGEALSREKRGVSATFILAGDDLPGGYHFAGYEAGGRRTGPLVVALVKGSARDHEDIYGGVKKLVRRNAGI